MDWRPTMGAKDGAGRGAGPAPDVALPGRPPRIGAPASKILVVDDEPLVGGVLCRWLEDEGYDCQVANDAAAALCHLEAGGFSLVVCDVRMPDVSGIELLGTVRHRYPDLAVIMVTGVDDRETAIRALELGAYGYLIKPPERNEVVINVVNALQRRRLSLEAGEYERRLEQKVRSQTADIRRSREEIILRLIAAQEYRNEETGAHVRRMGLYAEAIGKTLSWPEESTDMLRLAAPMHDVGKIGISDSVLLKPGKLTEEERRAMRTHTVIGARILGGTSISLLNLARDIALCHHERWDGTGYPRGLRGGKIPEAAAVVTLADVYDALVHDRVYRPALPEEEALATMEAGRDTQFVPHFFDVFLRTLPRLRDIRAEHREVQSEPPAPGGT